MLRSFEIALTFLTVFQVSKLPEPTIPEVGKAAGAFPVVGAVIGVLVLAFHWMLGGHLPPLLTAVLVVGLWVFLTGGLHLDGWTDCCDALAASASPEQRIEILKDSRLGTFAAVGLILLLGVKIAAVSSGNVSPTMLFLAPVIARGALVVAAGRANCRMDGMARQFVAQLDRGIVGLAGLLGFVPALIAGWTGAVAAVAAYLVAVWFVRFAESRLNTVNGDVLGASCELSEAVVLIIASVRW